MHPLTLENILAWLVIAAIVVTVTLIGIVIGRIRSLYAANSHMSEHRTVNAKTSEFGDSKTMCGKIP